LRCGGGDGAVHSRVLAFPRIHRRLLAANGPEKVITNGICERPSRSAEYVMNTFPVLLVLQELVCIGL